MEHSTEDTQKLNELAGLCFAFLQLPHKVRYNMSLWGDGSGQIGFAVNRELANPRIIQTKPYVQFEKYETVYDPEITWENIDDGIHIMKQYMGLIPFDEE